MTDTSPTKLDVPVESHHELLSSERRPDTDAVLTVRVIKSFEFRTQKSLVLKGINLEEETVGGLMDRVRNGMSPPFPSRADSAVRSPGSRASLRIED